MVRAFVKLTADRCGECRSLVGLQLQMRAAPMNHGGRRQRSSPCIDVDRPVSQRRR